MAEDTPRRALPDAPANEAGDAPERAEEPDALERAQTAYDLVSDILTPTRIGLLLAAVVLLLTGWLGGLAAVDEATEDLPRAEPGRPVEAGPFEITVTRARSGAELPPLVRSAEGVRHLFLVIDVRSTHDDPVSETVLRRALTIDAEGLLVPTGTPQAAGVARIGDGLPVRTLQPGLDVPTVVYWRQDAAVPAPGELTVTLHRQTWRRSVASGSNDWLDVTPVARVTIPVEPLDGP